MSPSSDRFIDFFLPPPPPQHHLSNFSTAELTETDIFPTAQNRSLANWKRWSFKPRRSIRKIRRDGKRKSGGLTAKKKKKKICAHGEESVPSARCTDDKSDRIGGTTARQPRVLRWIYENYLLLRVIKKNKKTQNNNNMQLCQALLSLETLPRLARVLSTQSIISEKV